MARPLGSMAGPGGELQTPRRSAVPIFLPPPEARSVLHQLQSKLPGQPVGKSDSDRLGPIRAPTGTTSLCPGTNPSGLAGAGTCMMRPGLEPRAEGP